MIGITDLTDGWLVDWSQNGGRFKEWIRDIELTAINHGYFYAIVHQPVYFYRRAKHVLSWVPILWDDFDWDSMYMMILMREKLRRMRNHFIEEHIVEDYEKIALEILIAENTLTRLIDDVYVDKDWEEHRKKYGEFKLGKKSSGEEESNDVRRIGEKEAAAQLADAKFLGDWIAIHYRTWWD